MLNSLWAYNITTIPQDSVKVDDSNITLRRFNDLNEKYSDSEFIYEHSVNDTGWWTRFKTWLTNFFENLFNLQSEGQASNITDLAIKIAGVIIFLLVIFFIFKAIMNKEGQWIFGKSSDKNIIPVTDIENNIHETNFETLIQNAETSKNYRLAIRYYYLWLLKKLTHAEIIEYDVEKTNSDYHREIKSIDTKKEFSYTSYLYNYIWYGEFNVGQEEFQKAKHAFIHFYNSIKA